MKEALTAKKVISQSIALAHLYHKFFFLSFYDHSVLSKYWPFSFFASSFTPFKPSPTRTYSRTPFSLTILTISRSFYHLPSSLFFPLSAHMPTIFICSPHCESQFRLLFAVIVVVVAFLVALVSRFPYLTYLYATFNSFIYILSLSLSVSYSLLALEKRSSKFIF